MSNDPRITKGRKTSKPTPPAAAAAKVLQVHPGVWKLAMKVAKGNRSRITVIHETRVEVR